MTHSTVDPKKEVWDVCFVKKKLVTFTIPSPNEISLCLILCMGKSLISALFCWTLQKRSLEFVFVVFVTVVKLGLDNVRQGRASVGKLRLSWVYILFKKSRVFFFIVSKLNLRWSCPLLRGSKCKGVLVPSVVFLIVHLYLYPGHFCGSIWLICASSGSC